MHILWIVLGLCGGIWIFWDTRRQGYSLDSSIRWAVGSFLVPAAIIPFYLLRSSFKYKSKSNHRNTPTPEDVTSSMSVRCYNCKNFFQGNPDNCPHCGVTLKE